MLTLTNNFSVAHELDDRYGAVCGYAGQYAGINLCIIKSDRWELHAWDGGQSGVLTVKNSPQECVDYLNECISSTELRVGF